MTMFRRASAMNVSLNTHYFNPSLLDFNDFIMPAQFGS